MRTLAQSSLGRFASPTRRSGWDPSTVTLAFTGQATTVIPLGGRSKGMKRNTGSWRPQTAWVGNVINNPYY